MSNIIKEIEKFQKDRLLDQQNYNWLNETANIMEELLEADGCFITKAQRNKFKKNIDKYLYSVIHELNVYSKEPSNEEKVDAYADIIVFCIGAIMKLGYDPECVLEEVAKEINSRTGEIIDGKFQKDTSPEAKAKWYKADFSKCK